ncbi:MAG: T9SS type A sorting domain-containing protein [Flavobacteriales bacterium]|nr:T9SS type A sorting domain-containing protein [Flavobacteriales bacterium]
MKQNLHSLFLNTSVLFLSLSLCFYCDAQTFSGGIYNNGANIVVGSGAQIYIDGNGNGDYFTTGDGAIDNDGVIRIEGDVFNNNTNGNPLMINRDNDGWVRFVGTGASLSLFGTSTDTVGFEKVEFNRGTGSTVTLNRSISIQGDVALTSGIINTKVGADTNIFIMESTTASDLTGGSSTAFINGKMRRSIATNTSTYEFPIGVGTATTDYRRVALVNNNLTGTTYLDVIPGALDTSQNSEVAQGLASTINLGGTRMDSIALDANNDAVYWEIIPDQQPTGGTTFGINAYIANTTVDNASYDGMFGLIKRDDAATGFSSWAEAGSIPSNAASPGRTFASGYAGGASIPSFSKFAIGFSGFDVLPIELVDFEGECLNGNIVLNWSTATEISNEYFTVLRSEDGYIWEDISTIHSQAEGGNSNVPLFYEYQNQSYSGSAYYKLAQTDYDGTSVEFSPIFVEGCESDIAASINAFTPDHDRIVVITKMPVYQEFQFDLLDASGRKVMASEQLQGQEGFSQFEIFTNDLSTGFYLVNITGDKGDVYTKKLFMK